MADRWAQLFVERVELEELGAESRRFSSPEPVGGVKGEPFSRAGSCGKLRFIGAGDIGGGRERRRREEQAEREGQPARGRLRDGGAVGWSVVLEGPSGGCVVESGVVL